MQRIRNLLRRPDNGSAPMATVQHPATTAEQRASRADHVTKLHADVSRLQQEVVALSDAARNETDARKRADLDATLAKTQLELDQAQREASKFQARI